MGAVNILEILEHIDPALLDYNAWLSVGMALKDAGYTAAVWDAWSRRDAARYHAGECWFKWDGFAGHPQPVTEATIEQLAKEQGYTYPGREAKALEWDDMIGGEKEMVVVDRNWIEEREIAEPSQWQPHQQLIEYLSVLFEAQENVGYVMESYLKDDRYLPKKGCYDRTAGQLIEELQGCGGDIGRVLGDYPPEAGAWIRFNPLDGTGVGNKNVTAYRYALVESDDMPIEQQYAVIRALELPVACLVHSGKKSLHAIVRIDADTYEDYRKRVDYLYAVCAKNSLKIDTQHRNPSRLSRMPGVMRNGRKQFLVDVNIGKSCWQEWKEWIESVNDDLPDPENMAAVWDNLPELSPPLINGVLRQGHKMLLAGPSKSGKSYALIELCIAIAEGRQWLAWDCAQGRVMYVNLELDRASCLRRFKDMYHALGWEAAHTRNIDVWNLRGSAVPMDRLAPKLIRRARKKGYIAIVIDPIYKVITGDENSADQMAHFCNQFDRVCTELGCAVIYCHHHSKGMQGNKRSMDRASGSGVFARDPDALLDLLELEVTETMRQELYKTVTAYERQAAERWTAWRIEGTLREFEKFQPVNLWFDYPAHRLDEAGVLKAAGADGEAPFWEKGKEERRNQAKEKRRAERKRLEDAIRNCVFEGSATLDNVRDFLGREEISERTLRAKIRDHGGYLIKDGCIIPKDETHADQENAG